MKNRTELAKHFAELGFKKGAEIGVFKGYYSQVLCENIPSLKLYCIDLVIQKLTKDKLSPFNCELIEKSSMDAVKDFEDESLDFVFIDANHYYENVKNDIEEWTKKVRKGGIVSGHDYYVFKYSKNDGVIKAVDEYIAEHGYKLELTER